MAVTFTSNSYSGRKLTLTISESVEPTNNRSKLTWTLTSSGGNSLYYSIAPTTVKINGTQVYSKGATAWDDRIFPAATGSVSGSLYVNHNSDGKKSVSVVFDTRVWYSSAESYGGTMTLTNIDRSAPTVSLNCSAITVSSVKLTVSSSTTSNRWWYSLNGGSSWKEFNSTDGTKKEVTVTGLNANTSYKIQVCARKKANNVDGYSSVQTIKTLGATTINSTNTFAADSNSVVITIGSTVYDASFYHKLSIKNGSTTILTTSAQKFSAGTANRSFTLNNAQKETLLKAMANVKSLNAVLSLTTYTSSACTSQVGSASTKNCTITITEEISKPDFSGFTYFDKREDTVAITQNDQILIQNQSFLMIKCSEGIPRNYATIKSYSVTIGDTTIEQNANNYIPEEISKVSINIGSVTKYGDLSLKVTCTDSRGFSVSKTSKIKVLQYEPPKISSYKLRRKDEIEPLIQLNFNGNFSAIKANGDDNTNYLEQVDYRFKKTNDDEWSNWLSIIDNVTKYGTMFSFSSLELNELDDNCSFNFQVRIKDRLEEFQFSAILPQGIPVMSFRKRTSQYDFQRVGINNPNPQSPLDVNGNIMMNGMNVNGFISELINENLNDINSPGIYCRQTELIGYEKFNYPANGTGFLEVICSPDGCVLQRYTLYNANSSYIRSFYDKIWSDWQPLIKIDNSILWSGECQMNDGEKIKLLEPISKQKEGIVLVWFPCDANNNIHHQFIKKETVKMFPNTTYSQILSNTIFTKMASKNVYVQDDEIVGNSYNVSSGEHNGIIYNNADYVLRYVIGF